MLKMKRRRKRPRNFFARPSQLPLRKLRAPRRSRLLPQSIFSHLSLSYQQSRNRLMLLRSKPKFRVCRSRHLLLLFRLLLFNPSFQYCLRFLKLILVHQWVFPWVFLRPLAVFLRETFSLLSNNNFSTSRCLCNNRCTLRCNNSYCGNNSNFKPMAVQLYLSSKSHL